MSWGMAWGMASGVGDWFQTRAYYQDALELSQELGDKLLMTYALNGLGNIERRQRGDEKAAAAFYEEALSISRKLGHKRRIAAALSNLAFSSSILGEHERTRELREESLTLLKELGDKRGIAELLLTAAGTELTTGNYDAAETLLEQSLALSRKVSDLRLILFSHTQLAQVAYARGEYRRAHELSRQVLTMAHSRGASVNIILALGYLAQAESGEGRIERAAKLFGGWDKLSGSAVFDTLLGPVFRPSFDRSKEFVHERIGEDAWRKSWEEGRAMSLEEAVAYALEPMPEPVDAFPSNSTSERTTEAVPASSGGEPYLQRLTEQLSKREVEVLRLVAEGLTAPQVAERLYLSVRTVENHLRSIYGKLNVSTRAAATRIAVEHGLLND
jgi:DNA-binding CsgD family transcriptional regulator/tetratricopeptide (TPR) repeat protein